MMTIKTLVAIIDGMYCEQCPKKIEDSMKSKKGISNIQVSLEDREGVVRFDPQEVTEDQILTYIQHLDPAFKAQPKATQTPVQEVDIYAQQMTCGDCVNKIKDALDNLDGVTMVKVSLAMSKVTIRYDPSLVTAINLRDAVGGLGFPASLRKFPQTWSTGTVEVKGMTCHSCVDLIQDVIGEKPGVESIVVSLEKGQAVVKYDPKVTTIHLLTSYIDDMGYEASLVAPPIPQDELEAECAVQESVCSVDIKGMTCHSCVDLIEQVISEKPGIIKIQVSLEEARAEVTFDPGKTTPHLISESISDMGYDTDIGENEKNMQPLTPTEFGITTSNIVISGMTCQSCVKKIEGNLADTQGVESVKVSLADKEATVRHNPGVLSTEQICVKIQGLGFGAHVKGIKEEDSALLKPSALERKSSRRQSRTSIHRRPSIRPHKDEKFHKASFAVRGMTCASCVANIEHHMGKLEGIESILVALMAQKAEVKYDPDVLEPETIATKITDLGYESTILHETTAGRVELFIGGMTCASCVNKIENHLKKKQGVSSATVALATSRGVFEYDSDVTGPRDIIAHIQSLGFEAKLFTSDIKNLAQEELERKKKKVPTATLR